MKYQSNVLSFLNLRFWNCIIPAKYNRNINLTDTVFICATTCRIYDNQELGTTDPDTMLAQAEWSHNGRASSHYCNKVDLVYYSQRAIVQGFDKNSVINVHGSATFPEQQLSTIQMSLASGS